MKRDSKQRTAGVRFVGARLAVSLGLLVSVGFFTGCKGDVIHPDPDKDPNNSHKYCANRKPKENNCMACSSQPGCGWCESPVSGAAQCQPGSNADLPEDCEDGWALATEDCEAPPPPPPPPAAAESSAPESSSAPDTETENTETESTAVQQEAL